ncbi:chromosome transmission fidelity protein 18 [Dendryphion nanum]|uniref:Chromosome transmission fidelity protein 18 n=1 Tax=Dendryphion nanum TaxID=256645 RepID=A0A9P9DZF2_9PLEO|nr:chromosome transmission fidelity protein 18 [Dendryphion nanum]
MSDYSPQLPTSFDPAIYLHSDLQVLQDAPASVSHSDELEAIAQCIKEDVQKKTELGIVIQHRAWNTAEAFRSEEERPLDTPIKRTNRSPSKFLFKEPTDIFPSSPPIPTMAVASSPITYPASSAPQAASPNKRKRSDVERSPLKDRQANQPPQHRRAFLDDSDDSEEEELATLKQKRRFIPNINDLSAPNDPFADYTPPASQGEVADPESVNLDELNDMLKTPSPRKQPAPAIIPVSAQSNPGCTARTASGHTMYISKKVNRPSVSYEELIASRSTVVAGKATKSYYGIDIHSLLDEAKAMDEIKAQARQEEARDVPQCSVEPQLQDSKSGKAHRTLLWTEKYRAKKFTDLVGDERTHRSVLRWLKGWDPIVFPGTSKPKQKGTKPSDDDEHKHRKVLLLTGPPGLGKTTLAHVCARQAGYEVQEINASDERSANVVKGRIRDMVGTENVRGINTTTASGKVRKAGKPVCVVVDEVDGVVGGSGGGGEGGFVKALIDLINLDERNSRTAGHHASDAPKRKKKGDRFRLLRPLILVCNDVYHPSLRPLRQSSHAEVIHIRKPALNMVVSRIHDIFHKEGIPADSDGVRRMCEATWGVSNKKEGGNGTGTGEGDIRSVMVVGEWVAGRLRAAAAKESEAPRLSRRWIEDNILNDLNHGGGAARSLGRGGTKDVVDRVFREGAGFPRTVQKGMARPGQQGVIGVAEASKRRAMDRLRDMINTSGDTDRILTDCFGAYPEKPFDDDTILSKPCAAYEWLHFHDTISSAVHGSQEWELAPYLSQSVLAFHDLFASSRQQSANPMVDPDAAPAPFTGPAAAYTASEQLKASRTQLMELQSTLSLPLTRMFRSPRELATELLPYILRMLSPDVKPVLVNTGPSGSKSAATASVRKASEKDLVKKAVEAMAATGVRFERSRVETEDFANRGGGWVFRMEPPLDQLASFETFDGKKEEKVRFAVRSVLESEWKRESARIDADARRRRGGKFDDDDEDSKKEEEEAKPLEIKEKVLKDFFGRVIQVQPVSVEQQIKQRQSDEKNDANRIWVSFHEGFSNAVRKPVTIDELMRGL